MASFTNPYLPTPDPSPMPQFSSSPKLSLFQQTLREEDEVFYRTFPAARLAALRQAQARRSSYENGEHLGLAGSNGFQFQHVDQSHYPCDSVPQIQPQSSLSCAVDPTLLMYQQEGPHAQYAPESQHTSFTTTHTMSMHHEGFSTAAPDPLPLDNSYQVQYDHQPNHPLPAPMMHSLPSPATSSHTPAAFHSAPQYYSSPQQAYQPAIPSPPHREVSAPLSPPALVQAQYPQVVNTIRPEPEHQPFFAGQQRPHQNHSIAPSRRTSRDRAHHRITPPYVRPQNPTHRSSVTRGTVSAPQPNMVWPVSPQGSLRAVGAGSNVDAGTFVNVSAATVHDQAAATPAEASSSPPATNHSGKRNPDKKPALACVFCRGRKIACGAPVKDGDGKTCNQCERRSLRCEYPTESRRGMRKKPSSDSSPPGSPSTPTTGSSKASNAKLNLNPKNSKAGKNKKR